MIRQISLVIGLSVSSNVWAADENAGKAKSATCVACHGANGVSNNPLWPNLAGQKEQYIYKQLTAFHDGVRQDPLMTSIAKMLKDQEMRDLAAYFAGLKATQ